LRRGLLGLSGSLHSWGAPVVQRVAHVVVLIASPALRLARLRERKHQRFGARIRKGGDLEASHRSFVDWAMRYDEPDIESRSRA